LGQSPIQSPPGVYRRRLPAYRSRFHALLVGYYEGRKLLFAAKVRAGFKPATRADILKRLGPPISRCPFADLPRDGRGRFSEGISAEDMADLRWVRARLSSKSRSSSGQKPDCCAILVRCGQSGQAPVTSIACDHSALALTKLYPGVGDQTDTPPG
jgi:hypothetical protein